MSDAGRAYVEKHSPYTGAMFLIHLRLGNIENDTYNHRLFIGDENLAKLCRCSTKTVQRAKAQMVRDGFLRIVKPATGQRVAEYEFLFPDTSVNITMERVKEDEVGGHSVQVGGHSVQVGGHFVLENETCPIYRNKEEIEDSKSTSLISKETSDTDQPSKPSSPPKPYTAEFDTLWAIYPRKVGRKPAYEAVVARLRAGVPITTLLEATKNYANIRRGKEQNFTLHPATFYGSSLRYEDYINEGAGVAETETPRASRAFSDIEQFLMNGDN